MKIHQNITNIILIIAIGVYALALTRIIDISLVLLSAWLLMIYGFASVLVSLGSQRKGYLFISTVIFLVGIVLYISNQYMFLNPKALIFPSSLFIIGSAFLMLFIDDSSDKVFLYASGVLIFFALISVWFTRSFGIMKFVNSLSSIIIDYSPVFIILIGISILVSRKKNNR